MSLRWERCSCATTSSSTYTRVCERGHAPVTFRAAWFLSAGKLVVSEHADVRDEAAYAGLIVFASKPEIGAAYAALRARPRAALKHEVFRVPLKHEVFAAYQRRFAPLALFEAAGVYRDFNLTTTPLRPPLSSRPHLYSK